MRRNSRRQAQRHDKLRWLLLLHAFEEIDPRLGSFGHVIRRDSQPADNAALPLNCCRALSVPGKWRTLCLNSFSSSLTLLYSSMLKISSKRAHKQKFSARIRQLNSNFFFLFCSASNAKTMLDNNFYITATNPHMELACRCGPPPPRSSTMPPNVNRRRPPPPPTTTTTTATQQERLCKLTGNMRPCCCFSFQFP